MALPASDTFDETEITSLSDHTSNSDHTWSGTDIGNWLISATGEAYAFGHVLAVIGASPASADYYAEVNGRTADSAETSQFGPVTRCNGGSIPEGDQTGYLARLNGTGAWSVERRVAGVGTDLASGTLGGFGVSTYYTLRLTTTTEGANCRVRLSIDGVEVANVSDTSPVTATNNPGMVFRGDVTRITSFSAAAISGGTSVAPRAQAHYRRRRAA